MQNIDEQISEDEFQTNCTTHAPSDVLSKNIYSSVLRLLLINIKETKERSLRINYLTDYYFAIFNTISTIDDTLWHKIL